MTITPRADGDVPVLSQPWIFPCQTTRGGSSVVGGEVNIVDFHIQSFILYIYEMMLYYMSGVNLSSKDISCRGKCK